MNTLKMRELEIYLEVKKTLELARTMMVDAKIVFLDEVGAGVNKHSLET